VLVRPYARDTRAMWVGGGHILVMHAKSPPQLLDPVTNTSETLAADPISEAVASATGDRVLFKTAAQGAKLLDVTRRSVIDVDTQHKLEDLAIAPDGSWLALVDRQGGVFVLDATGKELTRRDGPHQRAVISAARSIAVLTLEGKIAECRFEGGTPVWTELPLPLTAPHRVLDLVYRGEELDMWATTGGILAWNGARVFQRMQTERITSRLFVAGGNTLIIPDVDGKLQYLNDAVHGALHLPSVVPRQRIAAHPSSTRLMVAGDGLVVGFDLAAVVPRALPQPTGMEASFVDDHTLLASRGVSTDWQWMDVETGAFTTFTYEAAGLPAITQIDAQSGRVLVREIAGPAQRLLLFRKGSPEVRVVGEGRAIWGRLVPGDTIVFGVGDGRMFARIGGGEAREVAKLDGIAENAVALGYRRFAAHSSRGEIVRVDLTTDALERARVPVGSDGFLAADSTGRLLIVEDRRLLQWEGGVAELARFEKPIVRLEPYEGGVAVYLSDSEVQAIDLGSDPRPVRVLPPGKRLAVISFDGKVLANLGNANQLNIVELPSRARWTLPILFDSNSLLAVSPSARRVLQGSNHHFVIWTLPQAGPDLGPWLDDLTNASIDAGGTLAWPWQRPGTP
jgi:hypothetical protein